MGIEACLIINASRHRASIERIEHVLIIVIRHCSITLHTASE
jgi:hypothetical protein